MLNFSKNLIDRTLPDDCSSWFVVPYKVIHWSHSSRFFLHFFPFIIDNCSYGSWFRKSIRLKIFFTFYNNLSENLHNCCEDDFASAIICRRTLEKMQIFLGKCLGTRFPRWILKAGEGVVFEHTLLLCKKWMSEVWISYEESKSGTSLHYH